MVRGDHRRPLGGGVRGAMIFVDTSALFALASDRDQRHREARNSFDRLLRARRRLLTHSYVLSESMALLHQRLGRRSALALSDEVRKAFEGRMGGRIAAQRRRRRARQCAGRRQLGRPGELSRHARAGHRRGVRVRPPLHDGWIPALLSLTWRTRMPVPPPSGRVR